MYCRACIALLALVILFPIHAKAEPFGIRLTHTGDPRRTVAVSWNSSNAADNRVRLGEAPDALTRTVTATESHTIGHELGTSFTAEIDALAPSTRYYYQVGGASGMYAPSTPYSFATLASDRCAPLTLSVLGDNRADLDNVGPSALWSDILAEALVYEPQLFVNTGDMVKNGDRPLEWANFVMASETGLSIVPSLFTIGNHDDDDVEGDGALFNQLFAFPRNSAIDTEDYYSLDVGPIHFVSLNTQYTGPASTEFMMMRDWLEADLAANTLPWTIVFFHKAVYSRGGHPTGEEHDGAINRYLVPIFDAHNVDLVFNGHSHDYERFAPLRGVDVEFGGAGRFTTAGSGEAVAASTDPVADGSTGTTYIVTGGAGALASTILGVECIDPACTYCLGINTQCPREVFNNDRNATVVFDGRHNFVVMHIEGPILDVEVYATDAGNVGGAEQIDAFTMLKETFDPAICGDIVETPDAGTPDAGGFERDAAAVVDADVRADAGTAVRDSGEVAVRDAGENDAGSPSGAGGPKNAPSGAGCSCRTMTAPPRGEGFASGLLLGALVVVNGRRRTRHARVRSAQ